MLEIIALCVAAVTWALTFASLLAAAATLDSWQAFPCMAGAVILAITGFAIVVGDGE